MVTNLIRFVFLAKDRAIMVNRIVAVAPYGSTYSTRLAADARASNRLMVLTAGRKIKSIILLDDGFVVTSSVKPTTLIRRIMRAIATPLSAIESLPDDFKGIWGPRSRMDANEISEDQTVLNYREPIDTVGRLSEEFEDDDDDEDDEYEEDENDEDEDDVNTFDDEDDEMPMALPTKSSPVDYDDNEAPKPKRRGRPRIKPVEDSDDI